MPAFTFQERFVPYVRNLTKRQTIRKFRRIPVKIGQSVNALTGPYFKPYTILKYKPEVRKVRVVYIDKEGEIYLIDSDYLTPVERSEIIYYGTRKCPYLFEQLKGLQRDQFAWDEGFRHPEAPEDIRGCYMLMIRWWRQTHELPFIGFVTYW